MRTVIIKIRMIMNINQFQDVDSSRNMPGKIKAPHIKKK